MKVASTSLQHPRFDELQPPERPARHSAPVLARHTPPSGVRAEVDRQLWANQQASALQAARDYLAHWREQAGALLPGLARGRGEAPADALHSLDRWLGQRVAQTGGLLDGHLALNTEAAPRVRFALQGLASIPAVLASGKETLLFTVGRTLPGPVVAVLDDGMGAARLVRRLNGALGTTGLRVEAQDERLVFSANERDWPAVRGQLAIQGEGKLFAGGGFAAMTVEHSSLQQQLNEAGHGPRGALRTLLNTSLEQAQASDEALRRQLQQLQVGPPGDGFAQARQRVHDIAATAFRDANPSVRYPLLARAVAAQASISRTAVQALLA